MVYIDMNMVRAQEEERRLEIMKHISSENQLRLTGTILTLKMLF